MKKYPQPCVQKERLEQNLKVLERALLRYEPKEKVVKKAVPKKVEPPKPVPKKVEPPKPVPKKVEPPKVEPPKVEPPKVEPPKVVIGKDEIPIPEPKKEETKKTLVSQEIKPVVKAEKTEKKAVVNTIVKKELVRKPKEEEEKLNPNIKNLEFMTVEDLRKIVSREKLFRGVSKMRKEELLRRIKQSEWWRKNSDKDISKLKKDLCYNPHNLAIKDPVLVKMDRSVYENLIKKI
jgi:hypothetical protein